MNKNLLEICEKIESLRDSNRLEEAIDLMQQLLKLHPDWEHGGGWDDLSMMFSALGKNHEALDCIERARRFQPGHPVFEIHFVDLASKYGDADAAFQAFLELVRTDPDIYSDPKFYGPRNKALKLMRQVLARKKISSSEAKSRLLKVCPAAFDLWNELV